MKVLIADEHALFRDGLGLLIEQLDGSATILQASNFAQALKILDTEHKFDLIIIDLDMQDMVWEKGFDAIRAKAGDARLVVISASENVHNIRESLEKGASGYITKRAETKILSNALKLILDGGTYIPPVMLGKNLDDTPAKGKGKMLTNRQSQVLGLVAKGMSNKQIAYEMGVSEATVKLHINALLRDRRNQSYSGGDHRAENGADLIFADKFRMFFLYFSRRPSGRFFVCAKKPSDVCRGGFLIYLRFVFQLKFYRCSGINAFF